jgi:hypothetical protein
MQDNFNLAKYLRHGNKLLNENIGGYVDLKPINRLSELNDFGMTQEAKGGKASLELDWAGPIPELKAKCKHHKLACKVITMDGPGGGNPLVKIMGTRAAIERWLRDGYAGDIVKNPKTKKSQFVVDEEQLEMFLDDIEDDNDSMSLEELMGTAMEIEEIENYATDDSEDEKGFSVPGSKYEDDVDPDTGIPYMDDEDDEEIYHADVLSPEWEERFLGLGGDSVVRGIKYLVDDGFELDDIIKFLKNNEL